MAVSTSSPTSSVVNLKGKNVPMIWGVIIFDTIVILSLCLPVLVPDNFLPKNEILKYGVTGLASVAVLILTSLLPPAAKAVLVFWRLNHALPGHRAFSHYAPKDPRINMDALKKNVGTLPTSPGEQNSTWYGLFKKVEQEESVSTAHRHFLLFRDLASISVLLAPIITAALFALGVPPTSVGMIAGFLSLQYIITAIVARNHGIRLVTNVLAIHGSRRIR